MSEQLLREVRAGQDQQIAHARKRFADSAGEREANRRAREQAGVGVHDTMDQLQARATRLIQLSEAPVDAVVKAAMQDAPDRRVALERIIGEANNLQSWSFLPRGARAASAVARISVRDNGRELPVGTGFLVSPRLLMTNNHVLPDEATAGRMVIEFAAEVDIDNAPCQIVRFQLDPQAFFVTDAHLDVSLVLVSPGADGRPPGDTFGCNRLIRTQGKIVTGEPVNIIGHPMGRMKEIAIRSNGLELQLDDFLQYAADTERGNSGSPVFNDQWEVVALHHAGVAREDDQGRYLRKDGQVWQPGDGDDAIDWHCNEGARISVILNFLAGLRLPPGQAAILAELGSDAELPGTPLAAPEVTPADTSAVPARQAVSEHAVESRVVAGVRGQVSGRTPTDVQLVFLHGRSQQGKDPVRLRASWTAGLNSGLTLANMSPVDLQAAWFPFYGDRLVQVLDAGESLVTVSSGEAVAPAPDDPSRALYEDLVAQAARRAGMPDALLEPAAVPAEGLREWGAFAVSKLQRRLSWLSGRSGLDDLTISLVFKDVAAYLDKPGVREVVLSTVSETLPRSGRTVLVSHSLGTVVAMDLLTRLDADVEVPLLMTVGSPLGMDAVFDRLLSGGPHRPQRVSQWVNVWCAADAVAIGCPLADSWGSEVVEIVTTNARDRAHDIAEYLGFPDVARQVGAALTSAR